MLDILSPAIYIPIVFLTLVFVLGVFLSKEAKNTRENSVEKLPYFNEINLSMDYIGRNILKNGRFQYRRNIDSGIKYNNKIYNSLRHAGVLYSMYMYEKSGYTDKYKELRYKASEYFIGRYVKKLDKIRYVVVSSPKEEQINMPIAKTGAAGVALCALSNLYNDKKIDLKVLQGLGEFLLSMTDDNGKVYAYYDLEAARIDEQAEAVFYAGEAALGLLNLYEINSEQKWLEAAKKIILYLAQTRKDMDMDTPFDHWSILAIEEMIRKNLLTLDEKRIMSNFVQQMLIPVISAQITNKNNSYFGAFKENIRPGSIGTIMEGLSAGYFCVDNEEFKELIYKSLSIGCLFLNRVQVKTGEQAGGVPNSANWVRAGVSPNASVIRIDNIQHVMLGWLKFQEIIRIREEY